MSTIEDRFLQLTEQLQGRIQGWERSLKLTATSMDAGRLLCGVSKQGLTAEAFLQAIECMQIPHDFGQQLRKLWSKSNFIYLGLEAADLERLGFNGFSNPLKNPQRQPVFKVYLEFPVLLSTQTPTTANPIWAKPDLWCLGFKWQPFVSAKVTRTKLATTKKVTAYHLHPGLGLQGLQQTLLQAPLDKHQYQLINQLHQWLTQCAQAAQAIPEQSIDVLELVNENQPPATDLRLYDLELNLAGLVDQASALLSQSVTSRQLDLTTSILSQEGSACLGHISLGLGQQFTYFTCYWDSSSVTTKSSQK